MRRLAIQSALVLSSVLASGCASLQPTRAGFLPADGPPAGDGAHHTLVEALPGVASAGHYSAFVVKPVAFQPTAASSRVPPGDATTLAAAYRDALRSAFAARLPEVERPGPGVIVIRAAVTAVARPKPWLNGLTMAVALVPVTAGGAASEAEVLDGGTGQPIVAMRGVANGGRNFLGGPLGYLTSLGQARRALARQAQELATAFFARPGA